MGLSKEGYPKGVLVRAVWDCCHELYEQLGRAPTRLEFMAEIHRREPDRKGLARTHASGGTGCVTTVLKAIYY